MNEVNRESLSASRVEYEFNTHFRITTFYSFGPDAQWTPAGNLKKLTVHANPFRGHVAQAFSRVIFADQQQLKKT
jgi:hypothetical protein